MAVKDNSYELERNALELVAKAVQDASDDLAAEGQKNAPIDTGMLRASISAEASVKIDMIKRTVSNVVTAATPYALIQHEGVDFKHPKGGKAKYLSESFTMKRDKYDALINDALADALKRSRL